MHKGELHLRIHQHYPIVVCQQVPQLGLVRLEELAPNRHIVKKVLHPYVRTLRALARLLVQHLRTRYLQPRAHLIFRAARAYLHLRHGAYTRQGFPAKTHRAKCKQIGSLAYLRCRMPLKRHPNIRLAHPLPVVHHLKQRPPRIAHHHLYPVRTRVQTVLHQLFQTRRRTLDNLSRGYLIGYTIWQ